VHAFFASSDADNVEEFIELLSPARQAQLEREGGLGIVSTHFGKGFLRDGCVHPGVIEALTRLSKRPGWFPPVTELLDYVADAQGGIALLKGYALFRLEALWFWHYTRRLRRRRKYEKTELLYTKRTRAVLGPLN